jgi:Xaa-Pro aminopeptidase
MQNRAPQAARRAALARSLEAPALLFAGSTRARNYAANGFAYRANSHFLYLVGMAIEGAVVVVKPDGSSAVFRPQPPEGDALWHGATPSNEALSETLLCPVHYIEELPSFVDLKLASTLPAVAAETRAVQSEILGRPIAYGRFEGVDAQLAEAMIQLRIVHDEAAQAELRLAAVATERAHRAGMRHTRAGLHEWQVKAAMVHAMGDLNCGVAYEPIVSVHGEVLHNHHYENLIHDGDLLLADVGAETANGWAGDVTRTWPASGTFSPTQRALYEVVLEAQRRSIAAVKPGARYRDVHLASCAAIAEGLLQLGILRGASAEDLVTEGAHALFFPHGVGHLLGLDVHDMEDLGDRAGYAKGRTRSAQFGLSYLRLDRDLLPGMAVTIEPGYYRVPAILEDASLAPLVTRFVDRERLEAFRDVRGIRIEDDVLVTPTGNEVLTDSIARSVADVEAWCRA